MRSDASPLTPVITTEQFPPLPYGPGTPVVPASAWRGLTADPVPFQGEMLGTGRPGAGGPEVLPTVGIPHSPAQAAPPSQPLLLRTAWLGISRPEVMKTSCPCCRQTGGRAQLRKG